MSTTKKKRVTRKDRAASQIAAARATHRLHVSLEEVIKQQKLLEHLIHNAVYAGLQGITQAIIGLTASQRAGIEALNRSAEQLEKTMQDLNRKP